jgi:arginine/lysine/ornithine decarboxylase
MRAILLDANLLIAALDDDASTAPEIKKNAIDRIAKLLQDDDVVLAITPLIRYEVLRGVAWQNESTYQSLLSRLNQFEEFDIDRAISEMAANLYRYDVKRCNELKINRNLEKRKLDIFHFCSSEIRQLELMSEDGDVAKIRQLHDAMLADAIAI